MQRNNFSSLYVLNKKLFYNKNKKNIPLIYEKRVRWKNNPTDPGDKILYLKKTAIYAVFSSFSVYASYAFLSAYPVATTAATTAADLTGFSLTYVALDCAELTTPVPADLKPATTLFFTDTTAAHIAA